MPGGFWFDTTRNKRLTGRVRYGQLRVCTVPERKRLFGPNTPAVYETRFVLEVEVEWEQCRYEFKPPTDPERWETRQGWEPATIDHIMNPKLHWLTNHPKVHQ